MKHLRSNVWPLVIVLGVCGVFWLVFSNWMLWALFIVGVGLGAGLLFADKMWLFKLYQQPGESLYASSYITRSLLFLVAVALAGIFVVTSSGSAVGVGVILGLGWWLGIEFWPYRRNLMQLNEYLGQHHKPLSIQELQWIWRILYIWLFFITVTAGMYFAA